MNEKPVNILRVIEGLESNDYIPEYTKVSENNSMFYLIEAIEYDGRRYLKVGTTEKTLHNRFREKDYRKKYKSIRVLFACEVEGTDACYQLEDSTRSILRGSDGYKWRANDRFRYFQKPSVIPLYGSPFDHVGDLRLVKATKEMPSHYIFCEIGA